MEYSTRNSSPTPTTFLKRDYRLLRSKVLKILDKKFYHPAKEITHHEARMAQIQAAFKKLKDQELIDNPALEYRPPKILDYNFYTPTTKTIKNKKPEKQPEMIKELETLNVQNLCKYLNGDEIEMICEDPIYFLGKQEYRTNSALNDHKGWKKELGWVKEKRERENNWKEAVNIMRTTFQGHPGAKIGERLTCKTVKSGRETAIDWKSEAKESMLRIQSRKLKARSNQMKSLVQIRKLEEFENNKEKEYDWEFKINDRYTKVMEKKAEALKMSMDDKKYHRDEIQRRMDLKEKERQERRSVTNIYRQIDGLFKDKIAEECRERDLRTKINKAKTSMNFNRRRLFFIARPNEKEFEDVFNRSNSTEI